MSTHTDPQSEVRSAASGGSGRPVAPGRIQPPTEKAIAGWTSRSGRYVLRVRYTPCWSLKRGSLCVSQSPNGMTQLRVRQPVSFSLQAAEKAGMLLKIILNKNHANTVACAKRPASR